MRGDSRIRRGEGAAGFSREDECCWCWCWCCLRLLRLSPTERDSHLPGLECEGGWRPSAVASPPVWPWVESCFMSFIAVRIRFCSCRLRWQIVPLHDRAQTVEGWNRFPSVAYSGAQRRLRWRNISCADLKWGVWGQVLFTFIHTEDNICDTGGWACVSGRCGRWYHHPSPAPTRLSSTSSQSPWAQ